MNSTNRGANRVLIFAVGLILFVVGATAAAAVLIPSVRDTWNNASDQLRTQVAGWFAETPLGDTGVSWITPAILLLLVVAIIVLIVFITRQGHGHTGIAVSESGVHGRTIIDSVVAEHALQDALDGRPEFVSLHVSTYAVRRTPVLKVAVICRRGVSPKDAASIVEERLRALDALMGRELPALIQISGGFRSRVSKSTRLN
jgi:hypothetical protein